MARILQREEESLSKPQEALIRPPPATTTTTDCVGCNECAESQDKRELDLSFDMHEPS